LIRRKYISLHLHTIKSIGDAILKIDDYIEKAKKLGLEALAVTNHGTMSDVFDFYNKCKKNDIKPIIGCEVYVTNDRLIQDKEHMYDYDHLVLLAKNKKGFENLLRIHNDAQINGFYCKPRTDVSVLKEFGSDIIALSACAGGNIPKKILKCINDTENQEEIAEDIINTIELYKNIFDDFYLELQPGEFADQIIINSALIDLAKDTNTKTVITNDVHYLDAEDYLAHNIHVCASRKKEVADDGSICYPDKCYYVMTNDDIVNSLKDTISLDTIEESVNNIYNIIEQIEDYDIIPEQIYMPNFEVPLGHTEDSWLEDICFKKLDEIAYKLDDITEYTERLIYELDTIKELGFSGYFLTVRDAIMWAKNNGIQVGPGRGSVCGSLVAYLSEITIVNPIKYGLLFERFISIYRKGSVPDIDTDVQASRRDEVFGYIITKNGEDKCCLVSTFSERKAKAAIKDTGKVYGIDKEICDYVASLVPSVYYIDDEDGNSEKMTDISIEETINLVPEFNEYYEKYPDWINSAIKLSNIPKATSVHPAGTIISPIPLYNKLPMIKSKNENINATALNLKDAETAGFIKFDFLSLSTLGVFDKILKLINKKDLSFIDDDYDDPRVWAAIGTKYTSGLFQIGSSTYKQRMPRLKPKTIKELAACLALVRGPCIASKMDQKYMDIIEGKDEIELIHPIYDSVCKDTNGILIYQEQLMKICNNIGFTLEDGYRIMKHAAKKHIDDLKAYEKEFMVLAKKINMDKSIADRIFKMIVDSGLYSFNESHAIAYAIVCYISAYFKVYYPKEFMAASLSNAYERKEDVTDLIDECRRLGFKFLSPDINISEWDFTLEEDSFIRVGLCAVKSFGEKAFIEIEKKRPFTSLEDFLERIVKKDCSKRAIIPALFTGAFNGFYKTRLDAYLDYCKLIKEEPLSELSIQGVKEKISTNSTDMEFEDVFLQTCLVSNPVNNFKALGDDIINSNKAFKTLGMIERIKKLKDRNGNQMAFVSLCTGDGVFDAVIFAKQYSDYKSFLKKNLICKFNLKKNKEDYIINAIELSAA
jgi:DNA polymerase-3 subunit alpha